jgi:hypothetical protein
MNHILNKFTERCILMIAAVVFAITATVSSCDFLNIDKYLDEEMKFDSIFATKRYIEAYMWDAAGHFPDEGAIFGNTANNNMYTPGPMATDEAFCLYTTNEFQGMGFVLGDYNADNLGTFNKWKDYYQIIRQCNTIFARIDEADDWTSSERLRIIAYTRFIRAYAYYNLIVNFGPVILLYDEVLGNNEEMAYYNRPRNLYDECVEYVCTEFDEVAQYLPNRALSVLEFGRPVKGAAYALSARLRLIHASPLFNGGQAAKTYFGNWTRKTDGAHYISQQYEPRRWAVAAAAAKRVMDMTIDGLPAYRLHTVEADDNTPPLPNNVSDPDYHNQFPNGAAGIDHLRSYSEMFNGETVGNVNPEFIWARSSGALASYTQHAFPASLGGWNGLCVTQKIIDAYEMADGRTIAGYSDEYPYSEEGFATEQKSFSGYRLNAGVYNMYVNREMRFYASIGFSECFWPCLSTIDNMSKNQTITYYYDGTDGRAYVTNASDHPITGYILKKYINPIDAYKGTNARRLNKSFPIIRYAEILLSYAEALNNLGSGSYTVDVDGTSQTFTRNVAEIKRAINQVRYRAGLPGLTDAEANDPDLVMTKIKKERMIEFLHENRRYFDVRRWGDYEESESQSIVGMNAAASKESYYQRVIPNSTRIAGRILNRKLVFMPIPRTELKKIPSLDQNPGW